MIFSVSKSITQTFESRSDPSLIRLFHYLGFSLSLEKMSACHVTKIGTKYGRNADYQLEFGVEALQTMDGTDPFMPFISTGGTMRTAVMSALDTMGACHITTGEIKCYAALRNGGSTFLFDSHACTGTVEPSIGGATDAAALFRFNSVRDLSRFILIREYCRDSRSFLPLSRTFFQKPPLIVTISWRKKTWDLVTQTLPSSVTVLEPASGAAVEVELLPTAATQRTEVPTEADVPNVEVATAQAETTDTETEGSEAEIEGAKAETDFLDVEVEVPETGVPKVATAKAAAPEAEIKGTETVAEVAKVARKKAPWYRRLFRCLSCVRGEKD